MANTHSLGHAVFFVGFYILLVSYSLHRFYWTPSPLPASAPISTFSEARARSHVHVLTEQIGLRSVSTPGLQQAHHYIWDFCQQLKQRAAAAGTGVVVEASFENYTGSFDFDFVGERFINAYHNISNIILHISREGNTQVPAVLLVAHHDSPVGSPGAGDDASNVGVMLELASNLVASEQLPASPVMFLFSGAEEPLCQSAAAFMKSSPWAARVGVFINLESIGPGGSPIVFQHAGAWTIQAYAKGAAHPRGAITAQDIFDAGLVLGDTDYRQLSYLHRGGLPGIDIAYLLTGAAYHTDRDTMDAIRPGVLQETGDSLTGAVRSLAAALVEASNSSPEALQQLLHPTDHKRYFVSLAAKVMLTYSSAVAATLHNVPLIMALTAPAALKLLYPETALSAGEGLRVMASSTGAVLLTLLSVLLAPAGFGALRAWATGQPMVWFAHPWIAAVTYMPVAMAVMLMPFSHMDYSQGRGKQLLPYHMLSGALVNSVIAAASTRFGVGMSMMFALWAGCGVLAAFSMAQGMSLAPLVAALLSVAWPIYSCSENALATAIVLMSRMSLTGHVFIGLGDAIMGVLLGLAATSLFGQSMLPVVQSLLGRASRKVAAALLLLAVITSAVVSTGSFRPYSKDMPKRLMLGHVHYTAPVMSGDPSGMSSSGVPVPMRVVNSSWVIGSSDSTPAGLLSAAMGFDASEAQVATGNEFGLIYPVSKLLEYDMFPAEPAVGVVDHLPHVKLLRQRSISRHHHVHPGSKQLSLQDERHGSSHGDSSSDDSGDGKKSKRQEGRGNDELSVRDELTEVQLEVFTAKPCWGTLKLSGVDIVSWSITPGVWNDAASFMTGQQLGSGGALLSKQGGEGIGGDQEGDLGQGVVRSIVVKWTSEQQQGPLQWPITVRFYPVNNNAAGGNNSSSSSSDRGDMRTGLSVELHVGYVERTAALAEVEARMPEWSTITFETTTYVSKWDL